MDRTKIGNKETSKLSGFSWILLGKMAENANVTLLVRTIGTDANLFKNEIEKTGFTTSSVFANKATLRGIIKDIKNLMALDCIEYAEIGTPTGAEDTTMMLD